MTTSYVYVTKLTGYVVNGEGVIMDKEQNLASVTVNIRKQEESPRVTQIAVVGSEEEEDADGDDDSVASGVNVAKTLEFTDLGTLKDIMLDGGEPALVGGVGFFTVDISCSRGPRACHSYEGGVAEC